ncbi:aldehyde dehydrogenase [Vibrio sp. SCSIO 43140]|uniref:aldehyde dehydrogenase family protein n=1 Tax=Vibrio sp. SCSIO 43140 TaxID=2819100 RepID=UPI0020756101|nr:aldehyde dehydrogenase family protein [Vibrio sp. SCSIO 43140]USD61341.1 aldehyde dehydrogenase [Vibrio sp. SCSIO 43140]
MKTYTLQDQTHAFIEASPQKFYFNGEWHASEKTIDVIDPATASVITQVSLSQPEDVANAIGSAESAFKSWGKTEPSERAGLLRKLAELIRRDLPILAELESIDVGKPIGEAEGFDIPFAAECFEYFAGVAEDTEYEVDLGLELTDSHTAKIPYGVSAFVFPWNFPFCLCAWGIAPALAAGNTIVVKPASETPLSTLYLAKLFKEAGFPAGVANVLPGAGRVAGEALINDPRIKLMSFTGSTEVGRHIGEVCGRNLVPAKLELGGKGAAIVCSDADVDAAVEGLSGALLFNAGQVCCTASRWYVHESVYDEFASKAKAHFESIKLGRGLDTESQMGPICTQKQMAKILECVAEAQADGAEVICGGKRPMTGELAQGFYFEPTLLAGDDSNKWAQEEIFGPVTFLIKFSDEEEVVERANRNQYGLANSVWTQDLAKAKTIAHELVSGNSWINAHNVFEYGLHYGACNQSGCGGGVNSRATFEGYLRQMSVAARR